MCGHGMRHARTRSGAGDVGSVGSTGRRRGGSGGGRGAASRRRTRRRSRRAMSGPELEVRCQNRQGKEQDQSNAEDASALACTARAYLRVPTQLHRRPGFSRHLTCRRVGGSSGYSIPSSRCRFVPPRPELATTPSAVGEGRDSAGWRRRGARARWSAIHSRHARSRRHGPQTRSGRPRIGSPAANTLMAGV